MDRIFANGTYCGEGRWVDQKTEGRYTARYTIADGDDRAKVHHVERNFLNPDGTVAYEERSSVTFEPDARGAVSVTIQTSKGKVSGPGYALDCECHYDIDIAPDNHLEFTFHADDTHITGLGSATNKGNRTFWKESLVKSAP